jgi:hypothetical protein
MYYVLDNAFNRANYPSLIGQTLNNPPSYAQIVPTTITAEERAKLRLYKTAYSPDYGKFVEIRSVRDDANGEPIITARLADTDELVCFRVCELQNFVL